jgi:SAM-dependent methyltransferase
MAIDERRARARALATKAVAEGRPTAWFDELYREADAGQAIVPWDDRVANPHLVRWLDRHPARVVPGAAALDVGCGTGDNAAELARRGLEVTAFDVSDAAVTVARTRFAEAACAGTIRFVTADALALPRAWHGAFALVVEVYTLQVLPPVPRAQAARELAAAVAPGGTLVVVARGREADEPEGQMPWPLLRREVEAIAAHGLRLVDLDDYLDDESPPVRRLVATFERPV